MTFFEKFKKFFLKEEAEEFDYYIWFYEDERLAHEFIECINEYKLVEHLQKY